MNDSITYHLKDTVITVPIAQFKEVSKPVQIGIIGAWFVGLILVLFIINPSK